MSLATRCASCGTVFRVVQDQLKVSEGWVRCGRCDSVFNALEGLFDLGRDNADGRAPSTAKPGGDAAARRHSHRRRPRPRPQSRTPKTPKKTKTIACPRCGTKGRPRRSTSSWPTRSTATSFASEPAPTRSASATGSSSPTPASIPTLFEEHARVRPMQSKPCFGADHRCGRGAATRIDHSARLRSPGRAACRLAQPGQCGLALAGASALAVPSRCCCRSAITSATCWLRNHLRLRPVAGRRGATSPAARCRHASPDRRHRARQQRS